MELDAESSPDLTCGSPTASAKSNNMPAQYPPSSYPQSMSARANSVNSHINATMPIRSATPIDRASRSQSPVATEFTAKTPGSRPTFLDRPSKSADLDVLDDLVAKNCTGD